MGWNSWNHFGCGTGAPITEQLFKDMADAMDSSGMKAAGYTYVNVDDCWHGARDAGGFIHASADFTSGSMKPLADYVHAKGLKFGIYTCAGAQTCASKPGSLGYEGKDIQQYAAWGVDFVKVDWCSITPAQNANPLAAYKVFSDSIRKYAVSRPMVLSICNWGRLSPWTWGRSAGGQSWRTTADIQATWTSVTGIIDQQVNLWSYARPGGWNDPDMLEVGRGSLTEEENKSHFGMWCLMAAPLIAGNDLRTMSTAIMQILTNSELIAVNQDPLGFQAQRVARDSAQGLEVWARPLAGNARAVGLFNRSGAAAPITVTWSDLDKWAAGGFPWSADSQVTVRDLWAHVDLALNQDTSFSVQVPSHGLAVLKLFNPNAAAIWKPGIGSQNRFRIYARRVEVSTPGRHRIRILDLQGRVLWSRRGNGPCQYSLDGIDTHGIHVIQFDAPGSRIIRKF